MPEDCSCVREAALYLESPTPLEPIEERLLRRGAHAASTVELLAYLAGSSAGDPTVQAAAELVRQRPASGSRALVLREFRRIPEMDPRQATKYAAVFELGRRAYRPDREPERPRLGRPKDAFNQVRDLARAKKEHLVALYLDSQNGLLHRETVSVGSLNTTRTHPREILLPAVEHNALGFILAHNHPSGCLDPSEEDIEFSHSVRRAGELMGIELYDHIIVVEGGFTSLRERGLL